MHGLWVQIVQQISLLFLQAVIVTGTFLLHRLTKSVEQMIQAHMADLQNLMDNINGRP